MESILKYQNTAQLMFGKREVTNNVESVNTKKELITLISARALELNFNNIKESGYMNYTEGRIIIIICDKQPTILVINQTN